MTDMHDTNYSPLRSERARRITQSSKLGPAGAHRHGPETGALTSPSRGVRLIVVTETESRGPVLPHDPRRAHRARQLKARTGALGVHPHSGQTLRSSED